MKIVSIVGARPQFIKCNPVSKELRKDHQEILVHTGQHYDYEMSKLFFEEMGIPKPDYNLDVGSGPQGKQTGEMLIKIEKVLLEEKPDFVLVYGDTNSTLAGALAATKLHIKVGHVEAGLRSFDTSMPEEINRVLTDHASSVLFAPTQTAVENLQNEGITNGVYRTGDVMYDALLHNITIAETSAILETLEVKPKKYFLATIHRQSNTDNVKNLSHILEAFSHVEEKVIFPVHPRTQKFIKTYGLEEKPDFVLVYGDTNSTLAGALAATKLHIKVGHVEAGLRSFDTSMPEEINRVLTDHASSVLFAPTQTAVNIFSV